MDKKKLPKCPKGFRRNKKTGNCEKKQAEKPKENQKPKEVEKPKENKKPKRCPKGYRRNKKTGNCEKKEIEKKSDKKQVKQKEKQEKPKQVKQKEKQEKPKQVKKPKVKKQKICKDDQILNPATNKCVSKNGKVGKILIAKKFKEDYKSQISKIMNINVNYDKNFKDNLFAKGRRFRNYLKLENYFFKNGPLPQLEGDDDFQDLSLSNYYHGTNMSTNNSFEENKNLIVKGNRLDFSKIYESIVPYGRAGHAYAANGRVHITTNFRYPFEWLLDQDAYLRQLKQDYPEQYGLLQGYTGNGYRAINEFLAYGTIPKYLFYNSKPCLKNIYKNIYGNEPTDNELSENLTKIYPIMIEQMNEIIKNAPPLTEDILVYKGLKQEFKPSRKTFISSSLNLVKANSFQSNDCCKSYIILKKGMSALALLSISGHDEYEILLPFDTKLKLIEKNSTDIDKFLQKSKSVDVYEATN